MVIKSEATSGTVGVRAQEFRKHFAKTRQAVCSNLTTAATELKGDPVISRRKIGVGTLVLFSLVALLAIGFGGYEVYEQHSGVQARVTVAECHTYSHHRSSRRRSLFRLPRDSTADRDNCSGTLVNQPATSTTPTGSHTSLKIYGADSDDIGHDIDVHVHGRQAVADSWSLPWIALGVGCVVIAGLLVFGVSRTSRTRRFGAT
jgi:hypothetical protein